MALTGAALLLAACEIAQVAPVPVPPTRPAVDDVAAAPTQSLRSADLARYYSALQADLVAQGLLRTDGGGPDTPYDANTLARNFERIAFFDEYAAGAGLSARSTGAAGRLRRWDGPVRIDVSFGASVPRNRREEDLATVRSFVRRLARVTRHPISNAQSGNFHVLFMSADDTAELEEVLRRKIPDISDRTVQTITNLPRSIHCLVVAFSSRDAPQDYSRAVALIRAEHPDLIRLSCIHEELAQGLGLANDSPDARPSIFNDDDEFALLTSHDEKLLSMLYDPRLRPGMDTATALPVVRILAREAMGQEL